MKDRVTVERTVEKLLRRVAELEQELGKLTEQVKAQGHVIRRHAGALQCISGLREDEP